MAPVEMVTEELEVSDTHGGPPRDVDPNDGGGGGDGDGGEGDGYVPGAGLLAVRLALASITALFITIGIAYAARSQTRINWQHIRVPALLWLSTGLILVSSVTIEIARRALAGRNSRRYVGWLGATVGLGVAFLASQFFALQELMRQGLFLRHNPHSSLFYVVTGTHGLHLLGGIAALCFLLMRAWRRPEALLLDFRRQRARAAVSATYWHFLTVLWLALFCALLFWP